MALSDKAKRKSARHRLKKNQQVEKIGLHRCKLLF